MAAIDYYYYYYEIEFNGTPELVERFGQYDDDRCAQTFCIKTRDPIDDVDDMEQFLIDNFSAEAVGVDDDWEDNLITYVDEDTAHEIYGFREITAQEYEDITGLDA